ncbi:MAG: hypothetical protein EBV58_08210, partial [Actinobacteria bacterium]|nr:hypothetical protein [Actinomycetota bacterium]
VTPPIAYLARLGERIAPWNLQVPGVSSISVDLHKFGYTSKGASVIMYASKHLRSFQGFVTDDWLGGVYGSSGMLGTKSGGSMASAWAVMHFLGDDGYLRLTRQAREATLQLATNIRNTPELVLRAEPDSTLLCFGAKERAALNVFSVADELSKRGWYVDRQTPPDPASFRARSAPTAPLNNELVSCDCGADTNSLFCELVHFKIR